MTKQNLKNDDKLKLWEVETLRLTAFPSTPPSGEPTWWTDLIHEQPTNKTVLPKQNIRQETGPFEKGSLILQINPLRVDWHYTTDPDQPQDEEGFATIGDFPAALSKFMPIMLRWFEVAPSIKRLAFGATLLQPVPNQKAGYDKLSAYLRDTVKLNKDNSSDFLYQINRPRDSRSEITGLKINRLSKWSVAVVRKALMAVQMPTPTQLPVQYVGPESFACRLELDINTVPDFGKQELPQDKLSSLFQELVDLGKEIALNGDIP